MKKGYNKEYYSIKLKAFDTDGLTETFVEKQVQDIKNRSITPDTHKSRTMTKDLKALPEIAFNLYKNKPITEIIKHTENKEELEPLYYVDEYKYDKCDTSHVMHFGVNIYSKKLQEELTEYNKQQGLIEKAESVKSKDTNKQKVAAQNTTLTTYETEITKCAIYSMNETKSGTILIDVFERQNGIIAFENNIPKIHTVVLYQIEEKTLVLDPSNSTFSSHLANIDMRNIKVSYSEKVKIYKPDDNTNIGCNPNQWRDCIDIAVKLAFALNKSNVKKPALSDEDDNAIINKFMKECDAIKLITNQKNIDNQLPDQIEQNVFRLKQSSNTEYSEKITKIFSFLQKQLQSINSYTNQQEPVREKLEKTIREEYNDRLSVDYKPTNYHIGIKDFFIFCQNNDKLFNEYKNSCIELLGKELDPIYDIGEI